MNTLGILIAGAFFVGILHAAYIHLVRPVVIFAIRCRIVALRDELRVRALTGKIPTDDQGFRVLDSGLKRLCESAFNASFSMVLLFKPEVAEEIERKRDREILMNSDPAIREIWEEANAAVFESIVANSPMWWAMIPIIVICAPLSAKAKRISKRIFWDGSGQGMAGMGGACPA